jgi:PadR family transcriptional regulator, regulatory protein PadR
MTQNRSLSYSAAAILQAVANGYSHGFDIMDVTGLPSGTVYPALRRLEDAGQLISNWEDAGVAQSEQRPPRKYYQLTPNGTETLAEAVKRYRPLERLLPAKAPKPTPVREKE